MAVQIMGVSMAKCIPTLILTNELKSLILALKLLRQIKQIFVVVIVVAVVIVIFNNTVADNFSSNSLSSSLSIPDILFILIIN